ncbi:hypothetical protein EV126DRAFT_252080 [Verticillium dahliae]|nr:hypothetical protein EV126DRAFT_252080 [Verticillium dahliae]
MTSASTDLYPQYCFHLSPTFDQWCLLTAATIHALDTHNEYEGQGLFFHRNLPVKWVRLVGVVVAIDDVYNRRIFTIDDSSGACIECNVAVKVIPAVLPTFGDKDPLAYAPRRLEFLQPGCDHVDVGAVVDIKGSVALFRDEKTVKIQKVKIVRSTAQEVALWEKRDSFKRDVLGVPWVVGEKQMRRCRREAEGRERKEKREEKERQRREAENGELVTGLERASGARLTSTYIADDEVPEAQDRPLTGLEKGSRRKVVSAVASAEERRGDDGATGESRTSGKPRPATSVKALSQGLESSRSKRRHKNVGVLHDNKRHMNDDSGLAMSTRVSGPNVDHQVRPRAEGLERSRPTLWLAEDNPVRSEQPARTQTQGLERSRPPTRQRSVVFMEESCGRRNTPTYAYNTIESTGEHPNMGQSEGLERSRRAIHYTPEDVGDGRSRHLSVEPNVLGQRKKRPGPRG